MKRVSRGQIQKGSSPLLTLSGDQASIRNQEPFGKGNTIFTLGSVPALSYCVSSKADYGLGPQSDLGVVFFVTDFPSSLSQLLLLLWQ